MRAHRDLTIRARGGIFIYLVVWVVTSVWAGMPEKSPIIFYANLGLFTATTLLRIGHYKLLFSNPKYNTVYMYYLLTSLLLFNALHWGLLTTWILFSNEYPELKYAYMIIAPAFAMGGSAVLSISRLVRLLFPILVFVPSMIVGFAVGDEETKVMMFLAAISLIYILEASRTSYNDYHNSITNQGLAEERALKLENLSQTDPLTGIKNRLYFNQQYVQDWKRAQQNKMPLAVMMIDLDYFKAVNDKYGHLMGDKCLQLAADILQTQVERKTDTICRYGGEEFVILLPNTDIHTASKTAEKIIKSFSERSCSEANLKMGITCSIGVAIEIPQADEDEEELIKMADDALYQAKSHGRNQYAVSEFCRYIMHDASG